MDDDACPPSKKRRLVADEFVPIVVKYHCIEMPTLIKAPIGASISV